MQGLINQASTITMYKKPHNPNKQFLIGTGVLAFAVICTVVLFTLLSLRMSHKSEQMVHYTDIYQIELEKGFSGDSVSIYLNDSLLLNKKIAMDTIRLQIKRFSESNALLVVDNLTDKVTTFNLEEKGGRIILRKKEGIISMTSVDWE